MSRDPKLWIIREATLPIVVTLGDDMQFIAEFPPLQLKAYGANYDGAILNIAKAIQSFLEAHHVT
jgi:hypothetical protein